MTEGRRNCGSSSVTARPAGGSGRQRGFSLLEVVVAFAILALSLGLLLQVFSRALNTTALSGIYSRATTLAEARLNDVGVEIPLELGSYGGDPEGGLSWQVSIDPYELGDVLWEPVLEPLRVTSVVAWDEAGRRHQVALTTLRLADSTDAFGADRAGAPAVRQPQQGAADR